MKLEINPLAEQLDDYVLKCRAMAHRWQRVAATVSDTNRRGIVKAVDVTYQCDECLKVRLDTYSLPRLSLVRRRYQYHPEYRVKTPPGENRPQRGEFRAAYLARELKELLK